MSVVNELVRILKTLFNLHKRLVFILSTLDKITNLLKEQGKKQKDLTDFLGISKNAFTDWKSGRIKSYNKHLPQIAEFLDVSVDYLVGKTDKKNKTAPSEQPMSQKQQQLFDIVADLTDEELKKVIEYADLLNLKHNQ